MPFTFTADHTYAAYRAAVEAFRATHSDDPGSLLTSDRIFTYPIEIQERARFLDAWDAWLFSEEAQRVLGD